MSVFMIAVLFFYLTNVHGNPIDSLKPPLERNRFDIEEITEIENKAIKASRKEIKQNFTGDIFSAILEANSRFNESVVARKGKVTLYQGDIIANTQTDGIEKGNGARRRRAAIKNSRNVWPSSRSIHYIPYVITSSNNHAKSKILGAMREWQNKVPCLRFVQRRSQSAYLSFFSGGGCYSMVGKQGGKQAVSIGRGCEHHGVIVHEIGHALGFWHEQSRPDRDRYVKIHWNAIKEGVKSNFNKYSYSKINSYGQRYDYGSIMHYGAFAFAKNSRVPTITRTDGSTRGFGQRNGLSQGDVTQANLMYCGRTQPTSKPKPRPTSRPTTCRDKNGNCGGWAAKGYCKDSTYKNYMAANCCQSCKPKPVPACRDKNRDCRGWAAKGYCKDSKYKKYMAANCCQSCRTSQACTNKNKNCLTWARGGYCRNTAYIKFMVANCCLSCRSAG